MTSTVAYLNTKHAKKIIDYSSYFAELLQYLLISIQKQTILKV